MVRPAFALLLFAAPAFAQERGEPRPQISVTGEAELAVEPDLVELRSGVISEGRTAKDAIDANRKAMNAVVAAVRALGIAERDIQTARFMLSPTYDSTRPRPDRITGYSATNSVNVRVRKLDQTGEVIDRLTTAGANTFGGISFTVSEPSKLLDDARAQAVADARRKAELYAKAAGVALGRVFSIREQQAGAAPRPMVMRAAQAQESTPIAPGEQTLRVSVAVTFDLDR